MNWAADSHALRHRYQKDLILDEGLVVTMTFAVWLGGENETIRIWVFMEGVSEETMIR